MVAAAKNAATEMKTRVRLIIFVPLVGSPGSSRECENLGHPYFQFGNANTWIALLRSGLMPVTPARGKMLGVTAPKPVITATYCFPFTAYVIVLVCIGPPSVVSQRTFPVSASNALNFWFRSPQNSKSPAVTRVAPFPGTDCS